MAEKKKKFKNYIWVEKYRPASLDLMVLPKSFKQFFKDNMKDGVLEQNLLLYSVTPGAGKTSIAKALCADMGINPLYINISETRGIDVLRNDISRHASIKTLGGKPKIIILDEFDGATEDLQKALRVAIEKYSGTCRFIMCCNYVHKIIDPLREGRVTEFDFNMTDVKIKKEMTGKITKRLELILKAEKVDYDVEVVKDITDKFYPNIRKMTSLLQKYSKMYGIIDANILKMASVGSELYDMILDKNLTGARQFIIDNAYAYDELYTDLFKNFVPLLEKEDQPQAILIISQYQYEQAFSINKEIPFCACMIELMNECC